MFRGKVSSLVMHLEVQLPECTMFSVSVKIPKQYICLYKDMCRIEILEVEKNILPLRELRSLHQS